MIFKQPMNEEKALQKLAAMCAKAEHCTGEALDKMRKQKTAAFMRPCSMR